MKNKLKKLGALFGLFSMSMLLSGFDFCIGNPLSNSGRCEVQDGAGQVDCISTTQNDKDCYGAGTISEKPPGRKPPKPR
ncbi:MAG: hypothetical protein SFU27_03280 [Thermonemataceae bacterium]|nr:hypothetical protein [Thermonemataceae bacterium]